MSSIAERARLSRYLLLAVVAANVALALWQWQWQDPVAVDTAATDAMPRQPVAAGQRFVAAAPAAPVEQVALRRAAPVCRAWGPFTDLEAAESLARRLELPSEDFEVFQSEVRADPDYLVTVRAPGNREAAERTLRELNSQKLDSYILERGASSNVLAVGVFSVPGGAETRQRQLADLGYQADIEPLQRSHRVYHLLARVPAARELEIPPLGGCSDIAPMEQFL